MPGHALDLSIIIFYLAGMLAIGFYYRRFAGKSMENFFLAGRSIPGWLNGISYTAALISADAATAYGGLAAVTGIFVCWWYLTRFALAFFIGAVLFAIFWRRLNLFTSLEFYELRFQGRPATLMRFWIAFRTSFVAMPAWTGITLLAACKILSPTMGFSREMTLLLVIPIAFSYVFLSGYKGVVVSNLIQMTVFFCGSLCLALLTLWHFGGPAGFAHELPAKLGAKGAEMLRALPPIHHDVFPLAAALAWLFGQSVGYGGDTAPMGGAMEGQRILSTRNPQEAVVMYVTTAICTFTLLLFVSLPCVAVAVLSPELTRPESDRELAYGSLMKMLLPPGMMGLVVSAMLAGVMSVVSDNLNFGSQVMVSDIYRRWIYRSGSEKEYLIAGKACLGIVLILALLVVYNTHFIFNVAVLMLQLSSAELPANWAQWWWWRFNGKARIAASFGGALIFLLVDFGPRLLADCGFSEAERWQLPWWWQTFSVMGLTSILWIVVALVTKPDPPELLLKFYRKARPLGWWGPIARMSEAPLNA